MARVEAPSIKRQIVATCFALTAFVRASLGLTRGVIFNAVASPSTIAIVGST